MITYVDRTYPPGEWRVIWSVRHAVGIGQCVYATRAGAREGTRNVARGFQRDGIGYAYAIVSPGGVVTEDAYLDAFGLSTPWRMAVVS